MMNRILAKTQTRNNRMRYKERHSMGHQRTKMLLDRPILKRAISQDETRVKPRRINRMVKPTTLIIPVHRPADLRKLTFPSVSLRNSDLQTTIFRRLEDEQLQIEKPS